MHAVTFTVPGKPIEQGNHRVSASGYVYESNPLAMPHRDAVTVAALAAIGPLTQRPVWIGPVAVSVLFAMPRPRGHYGTGRNATQLRPSAPPEPITAPDVDKLQRLIGDALGSNGAGVIRDDAQIVAWRARKRYAEAGDAVGTTVRVSEDLEL